MKLIIFDLTAPNSVKHPHSELPFSSPSRYGNIPGVCDFPVPYTIRQCLAHWLWDGGMNAGTAPSLSLGAVHGRKMPPLVLTDLAEFSHRTKKALALAPCSKNARGSTAGEAAGSPGAGRARALPLRSRRKVSLSTSCTARAMASTSAGTGGPKKPPRPPPLSPGP